jgi:hypothetical protein
LGNQLFQFAAAIAFRDALGGNLYLGIQGLNHYKVKRTFDLGRLVDIPDWCRTSSQLRAYAGIVDGLMGMRIGRFLPFVGVNDRNFRKMLTKSAQSRHMRSLWLDGYFQRGWDWHSFEASLASINSNLRVDLAPPISNDFDCVIHIRGSDFLTSAAHHLIDLSYYIRAIQVLHSKFQVIKSVLVITDDRKYAVAILEGLTVAFPSIQFEFLPDSSSDWFLDFTLLRSARLRIIGNSTFSWWASAIDSGRALTVTPSQWMADVPRDLFLPWEIALPVGRI